MRYTISPSRTIFDKRTNGLKSASYKAKRLKRIPAPIRDLTYQGAILQTSAAIEDYIKDILESWAFKAKSLSDSSKIPIRTRLCSLSNKITPHFSVFSIDNDEKKILKKLENENDLWPFVHGTAPIPDHFDGSTVFAKRKYPSSKNMKILFSRIGVDNIFGEISRFIQSDAEMRIEAFNSIRTALAHSNPPNLTYLDVKREITHAQSIVRGMDRVFFNSLAKAFNLPLW